MEHRDGSIYVQLGLGIDKHPQDTPLGDQKTRGAAGYPSNSHMMDIVMGREEVCNGNLRLMRISILMRDGTNVVNKRAERHVCFNICFSPGSLDFAFFCVGWEVWRFDFLVCFKASKVFFS